MTCVTAFIPLRGNQVTESFRVYLDRLVAKDMHFHIYVDQRQTRPFDEIVLYSGWLPYKSHLTAPHLSECVMRKFGYTQIILRHPIVYAPLALIRRHIKDMFDDYDSHMIPETAWATIAESDWSYVDGYIRWFFRVSHPYMVHAAPGDTPRLVHQDILEEEQAQLCHVEDVSPMYCSIVEITRTYIDRGIFSDGSNVRQVLDAIITEARGALLYQRHRWRTEGLMAER
ncbi:uncharacterized protein LOC127079651 [Lathyrus oleraceus]|uniref:uncharacterized protein LOC127079651 n=1 Tax=Pisum sativum TaxID=3888 RepID=UPI0021D34F9D|nr:uncharacterized protein LOC127079651 [Pisum sativum]